MGQPGTEEAAQGRRGGDRGPLPPARLARERALGLLYESEVKGVAPSEVIGDLPAPPDELAGAIAVGVEENQPELDALISRFARDWAIERMPALDRALLRMAVFELVHRPDVPTAVVLSEAVELAKQYSTDDSGRFVNGVLAGISTEVRSVPATQPEASG